MYRVFIASAFVVIYIVSAFSADTSVKIVNGDDANIEDHPWMVSIQVKTYREAVTETHVCGGAIIDRSWVLTAAHCGNAYDPLDMKIVAGSSFLSKMKTRIPVNIYYEHENYTGSENDLMLLQLKTPLKFGSAINKIDLDTDIGKNYTGEVCTISGWGKTNSSDGKNKPDRLQVVSMSVVTNDHCHTGYLDIFPDKFVNKICLQEGEKDSCNEDSGGPMVCSKKLVGILNFGIAPCNGRIPSIYARVSAYTDWIKEKIKNKKKKNKKDQKSKNNQKNKKDKKSKNNRNNKNENKTNKKNNRN